MIAAIASNQRPSRGPCGFAAGESTRRSVRASVPERRPPMTLLRIKKRLAIAAAAAVIAFGTVQLVPREAEAQTMAEYGVLLAIISLGIITAITAVACGIAPALHNTCVKNNSALNAQLSVDPAPTVSVCGSPQLDAQQ